MAFKRYASPIFFLDTLILQNEFSQAIDVIYREIEEEKLWQLYLSDPLKEKSFIEWREAVLSKQEVKEERTISIEVAKKGAKEMLKTFKPY